VKDADRLTAAELAGEIAQSRARLSRDLATLDRDYALRHLAVRAIRLARRPELEVRRVGEALRKDVVPLAFIGVGLGWFALAGERSGREVVARLTGAVAALQHLARELGFAPGESGPPPEAGEAPPS
jgi:hypothetical protein